MKLLYSFLLALALTACTSTAPIPSSFKDLSSLKEEQIKKDIEAISAEISNKNIWE